MKYGVVGWGVLGMCAFASWAQAQDESPDPEPQPAPQLAPPPVAPPPAPPQDAPLAADAADDPVGAGAGGVPRARVGFQMAIRTGYSLPMGDVHETLKMSDWTSGQVPLIFDIGGKIIPELFLGGWLGLGFGGADGALDEGCKAHNASCRTLGVSIGIEAQYHILPDAAFNPWVGYGIGYESLRASTDATDSDNNSITVGGLQFARLMAGGDFRVSRVFGIGPFVDYSLGKYSTVSGDDDTTGDDIAHTSMHQWLTFGVRGVFFP